MVFKTDPSVIYTDPDNQQHQGSSYHFAVAIFFQNNFKKQYTQIMCANFYYSLLCNGADMLVVFVCYAMSSHLAG